MLLHHLLHHLEFRRALEIKQVDIEDQDRVGRDGAGRLCAVTECRRNADAVAAAALHLLQRFRKAGHNLGDFKRSLLVRVKFRAVLQRALIIDQRDIGIGRAGACAGLARLKMQTRAGHFVRLHTAACGQHFRG